MHAFTGRAELAQITYTAVVVRIVTAVVVGIVTAVRGSQNI